MSYRTTPNWVSTHGATVYRARPRRIYRLADWRVTVSELEHALLIRDGQAEGLLDAGRHWIRPHRDEIWSVPSHELTITTPGQETLTADGAGIRATVSTTFVVSDAIAAYRHGTWREALYLETQLALRDAIGAARLEELLARRNGLDRPLTERVAGVASEFGLAVGAVRVRDLITPGELKRAVAEVVQAKLSGQAAVERARGETAALRSLANAARAAADNPALLQLRLIQQMESSHGNTYVLGTGTPPIL